MTSISKNVYIDKLDNTVKKYNNIYHSTIKLTLVKKLIIKILNSKLVILLEYQNINIFAKGYVLIGLKKFSSLKRL